MGVLKVTVGNNFLFGKLDPVFAESLNKGLLEVDIPTEVDPVFTAWLSVPPNVSIFTNDAGYITSETDPIYTASSWFLTTNNSANWDTAYGWGNHASAGYLTSYTETDPVFLAAKDADGTLAANSDSKWATQKAVKTYADTKQAALVSGTNIKTVGGVSLLGSGDVAVSSGAMTLITSGTVSGASTLDLTLNTSSYSIYKLVIYDYVAQTNNTDMWLRVGTGGTPAYQSGGSDYTYYYQGSFGAYGLGDSKIVLLRSSNNASAQRVEVDIYNPAGTTYKKKIKWDGSCNDAATPTYNYKQYGDGLYNTNTNAITGLRIMQSSGNITYCEYRLYGIS